MWLRRVIDRGDCKGIDTKFGKYVLQNVVKLVGKALIRMKLKGKDKIDKSKLWDLKKWLVGEVNLDFHIEGDIQWWHLGKDDNGKKRRVRFRDACMTGTDENRMKEFQVTLSFPPLDVVIDVNWCRQGVGPQR